MPNPFGVPEISVTELAGRQTDGDSFIWLDVREPNEHAVVRIEDERIELVPLSRLASEPAATAPPSCWPRVLPPRSPTWRPRVRWMR